MDFQTILQCIHSGLLPVFIRRGEGGGGGPLLGESQNNFMFFESFFLTVKLFCFYRSGRLKEPIYVYKIYK